MKLHGAEGLPNPARVRIAPADADASAKVEFMSVDGKRGRHCTEKSGKINRGAVVPRLELADARRISPCNAITEYNDGTYRERAYIAGEKYTIADVTMFVRMAFTDFDAIEIAANLTSPTARRDKVSARSSIAAQIHQPLSL